MPLYGGTVGLGIRQQPAYGLPLPTLHTSIDHASRVRQAPATQAVLDTVAGGVGVNASATLSWTHRIGPGPNRVVYVGVDIGSSADAAQTASVTFGGVAMTSRGKVHANNTNGGYIELFRLIAPPMGLATVVVTIASAPISLAAGSVSWFNLDQTAPDTITTNFGSGTTASVTSTSADNHATMLMVGGGSPYNAQPNGPDILLWLRNQSSSSANGCAGMSYAIGNQAATHSWTLSSDSWSALAADLTPSFAADSTFTIDTPWWTGDFETGDLTQFSSDTSSFLPSTPVVATSSPSPAEGTYRGAFSVPAGTSVAGAGVNPRSEATFPLGDITEGEDWWFGGWTRVNTSDFAVPAAGQFSVITQWKNNATGSPPLELSINNDNGTPHYRVDGGFGFPSGSQQYVAHDAIPLAFDTWTRWDWHIVFSSDPNIATINLWKDGVQYLTGYHPTTLSGTLYPGQSTYWKIGYYRSEAITAAGTVYHDGWKMGQTATSVNFGAAAISLADNPGWAWSMNI